MDVWTSERARMWSDLKYQYDDLTTPPAGSGELLGQSDPTELRKQINQQYGSLRSKFFDVGEGFKGKKNDYIINLVYDR